MFIDGVRRIMRLVLAGASLLFFASILTACGEDEAAGAGDGSDQQNEEEDNRAEGESEGDTVETSELTVPMVTVSAFGGPQFIAQELGLWEQYGLTVDQPEARPAATPFRQVPLQAVAGGWGLNLLAGGDEHEWLAVMQDIPVFDFYTTEAVSDISELTDSQVGITGIGGGPHQSAVDALRRGGVDSDMVEYVNLAGPTGILDAIREGEVAGGPLSPPVNFLAEQDEELTLQDSFADQTPIAGVVVAVEPEWASDNYNTIMAFLKGYAEAGWIYLTDPDTSKQVLAQYLEYNLDDPSDAELIDSMYEDYADAHPIPLSEVSPELLQNQMTAMPPEDADGIDQEALDALLNSSYVEDLRNSGFFDDLEDEYGPLPE